MNAMLSAPEWVIQDYQSLSFSVDRHIALRKVPPKSSCCDCLLLADRMVAVSANLQRTTRLRQSIS